MVNEPSGLATILETCRASRTTLSETTELAGLKELDIGSDCVSAIYPVGVAIDGGLG
jgi:hypothetical protein